MPFSEISEFQASDEWIYVPEFENKNRTVDYKGRDCIIISEWERPRSVPAIIGRGFLGVLAVVCTFAFALFLESVQDLFRSKETIQLIDDTDIHNLFPPDDLPSLLKPDEPQVVPFFEPETHSFLPLHEKLKEVLFASRQGEKTDDSDTDWSDEEPIFMGSLQSQLESQKLMLKPQTARTVNRKDSPEAGSLHNHMRASILILRNGIAPKDDNNNEADDWGFNAL